MIGAWLDLGRLAYAPCWALQRRVAEEVAAGLRPDTLLIVEHDPVFTLGANFRPEHLLWSPEECARRGVSVERTDRGGDVTYHGPGQLVLYPIFDVARHGRDLHRWLRDLEEATIRTVRVFGVEARRFPPHTGVWVADRKIAAIGIKVRRWVNLHGIALNCENDLEPFSGIVPCGIRDYGVTSLTLEVGRRVTTREARDAALGAFASVFGLEWLPAASPSEPIARSS